MGIRIIENGTTNAHDLQESDAAPASEALQRGLRPMAAQGDVWWGGDPDSVRVPATGEGVSHIEAKLRTRWYSV